MSDRLVRNLPQLLIFAMALIWAAVGNLTLAVTLALMAMATVLVDISEHLRDLKNQER